MSKKMIKLNGVEIDEDDFDIAKDMFGLSDEDMSELVAEQNNYDRLDDEVFELDTMECDAELLYSGELDWNDTIAADDANHQVLLERGYGYWSDGNMYVRIKRHDDSCDDSFDSCDEQMDLFFPREPALLAPKKPSNAASLWAQSSTTRTAWSDWSKDSKTASLFLPRTSDSHPLEPSYIAVGSGKMGLFICPGKKGAGISGDHDRTLSKDLAVLQAQGMNKVYGLMPMYEMIEHKAEMLPTESAHFDIEYAHRPWTDRATPDNDTFEADVAEAANDLWCGKTIGVHCRGGLGRTGVFAGCVLANAGFHVDDIISLLHNARGTLCPETDAQKLFLRTWAVRRMIERGDTRAIKDIQSVTLYNALKRC